MRIKLNCAHADTCLPDYWSGHHLPHIQVAVDRTMSFKALRAALRDELRQGAVMGSTNDARLLSDDVIKPEEEPRADALTKAAYAAINRDVVPARKGGRLPFPDIEPAGDCEGTVYAYFVFREGE